LNDRVSFSALQRAENSSMPRSRPDGTCDVYVSVLFSEPKIPQFLLSFGSAIRKTVSVLFSEPKIPQ